MSIRTWLLAWLPVLAWAGLVFAFSAQPDLRFLPDAWLDFVLRKVGHAGVFGILALLAWRARGMTTAWRQPRPWAVALGLTVTYAITDELHQGFVGGRFPSPVDVGIDIVGALVAIGIVLAIAGRRGSRGGASRDP